MTNIPQYISQTEAAARLGVTDPILKRWRTAGIGPEWRRTAAWLRAEYREADVERLREGLITLGGFGLSLHGVMPLTERAHRTAGPSSV